MITEKVVNFIYLIETKNKMSDDHHPYNITQDNEDFPQDWIINKI